MAELTADVVVVPDGPPSGAPLEQKMKSVLFKVDAAGKVTLLGPNYSLPTNSPAANQVMRAISATESEWQNQASERRAQINSVTTIVNGDFTQNTYEVDTSDPEFNITLPKISTVPGQRYTFIKTTNDTKRVLMFFNGAETANGFPRWQLNSQYDSVTFIPDGTNWFVVILTPHIKTLNVVKDATVQAISTGTPTVVSFQTVLGVSPLNSFDNVVNFDWDPLNGGYDYDISIKLLQLDSNDLITVCLRFDGVIVACAEQRATANNQDIAVRLQGRHSTFAPPDTVLTGKYDVTVEHNQGGNLNLDTDTLFTYWKMDRGRF